MWSQHGSVVVISSTLALLLKVRESYRRQALPVTLEPVEQTLEGCSLQSFYKKLHYYGKSRVTFIQDIK